VGPPLIGVNSVAFVRTGTASSLLARRDRVGLGRALADVARMDTGPLAGHHLGSCFAPECQCRRQRMVRHLDGRDLAEACDWPKPHAGHKPLLEKLDLLNTERRDVGPPLRAAAHRIKQKTSRVLTRRW